MKDSAVAELLSWIAEAGLQGRPETELVEGFCRRAQTVGLPLARATPLIDTLHPNFEGRAFQWERGAPLVKMVEYGSSSEGEISERWRRSALFRLLESGELLIRRRIDSMSETEFSQFPEYRAQGLTDYVGTINRFAADGAIGVMDCFYGQWLTDRDGGFSDRDVAAIARLAPFLGLAIKSASLARIAETLVETYLGRDAGHRVLSGRIARGVADRIEAVLWFSDLRNFTRIADTSPPDQIIPLLNDYADAIISAIHANGGDVLKLIGDGVLAIFRVGDREGACSAALDAALQAREAVRTLNARRRGEGVPTTDMYLGLHIGEVFYGNIGSNDRLDFTVVGPAVNEVSRIAAMCRSVDQPLLMSSAFASAAPEDRRRFASVGRFALRGVGLPQDLFTLDMGVETSA